MNMRKQGFEARTALAALAMLLAMAATVAAQPGGATIEPGEVLQMVVPGRPDLDRALVVKADGMVEIPQVGEVRLAGLGLGEAGVVLKQRLRLIAPTLDAVEVSRAEAAGFRIYVIGQVGHPGMHEFPTPPTVWDVMRAAGGPLRAADLREARVIREESGAPRTTPMDLSGLLEGEGFPNEPLRDGDTLVVPMLPDGVSGVPSERGVKVFGGVAVPSIVQIDGPTPLMDVLMLAGSPTPDANTKKIHWVHASGGSDEARLVNLRLFLEKGDPAGNPLIYPGDTVQVTLSRPGTLRSGFALLLGTAATLSAIYVAVNSGN